LNGFGKGLPMIVGITVIRCIVLPGIGVGIVKCVVHLGLIHPDPLYEFVLLLQFAVPPAVSLSKFFIKPKPFLLKTQTMICLIQVSFFAFCLRIL